MKTSELIGAALDWAAENAQEARKTHPNGYITHVSNNQWMGTYREQEDNTWVKYSEINSIEVVFLGQTDKEAGVILASFNAG